MTSLKGDLRSIMGTPFGGVGHAVLIFSRVTRAAFNSDSVVLQLHDRIEMPEEADGKFQVDGLDPGPIRIELEGGTVHNHGWNIDLPDEGVWSLTDLVDAQVDWSPAVIGRAEAAARESREHADRAEAGADRVGTAEQVGVWASEASTSASAAASAESGAISARDASQSARDAAEGHANRAATSESNAVASENAAKQSETNAGDFAAVATTAATEAVDAMTAASESAASIGDSASRAATSAESAAQYESSAATHAQNATEAAEKVGTAAELDAWARAAQEAADRVGTAEQVGTWASESSAAASRAAQSESNASSYAGSASVSSQQSIQSATVASDAKTDAALSASTAGEHADRAVAARQVAEESATSAMSSAGEAASILSETLAVVTHGDDPYYPRPETERRIMWLGSAIPLYRKPGDLVPAVETEPAPWTPEMLDLVAWYDPADGYESGTVSQVVDRGPHGLHMAVGGTGTMEVASGVLNLPSFQNNGTAFATSPDLPAQAWEGDVTVYMVAQLSAMPTVSALFDDGGTLAANRAGFWVNSGGRVALTQGTNVQSEPYLVTQDQTFLLAVTFSGGASTQAELNGTVVVGPADAGSNTPGKLRLFANPGGSNISSANIGDVIIAKNVTPEQHADISEWLRTKWGLS